MLRVAYRRRPTLRNTDGIKSQTSAYADTRTSQSCTSINEGLNSIKSCPERKQFPYGDCKVTPYIVCQSRTAQLTAVIIYRQGKCMLTDFPIGDSHRGRISVTFHKLLVFSTIILYCQVVLQMLRKLRILPTRCICAFRMVFTTNSICFPKQH
jgi:hypothetical protein